MGLEHYPYRFVQRIEDSQLSKSSFFKYKLLYTFKSPKSHQWYWVWVEVYDQNFYALKFHLKAHKDSSNKYHLMTGLNEARAVIHTCIAIMKEVAALNPQSSFGFIGANMLNESTYSTKRFRIYSVMMATYFTEDVFEHYVLMDKSAYLLVRRTELEANPFLPLELSSRFKQIYDYFD